MNMKLVAEIITKIYKLNRLYNNDSIIKSWYIPEKYNCGISFSNLDDEEIIRERRIGAITALRELEQFIEELKK